MKLALLNTTIATTDGLYAIKSISLEDARILVQGAELDSAIGHQSTAEIMSALLGVDIPMNRQMFAQQSGQVALVFKLKGRPLEGAILNASEIEAIGYEFKTMERIR